MAAPDALGNVLVTGGASGLGEAVVQAVRDAGGTPIALDRVEPKADVEHEIVDLVDRRDTEDRVRAISQRVGGLDAVVTAAGVDSCGKVDEVPAEDWDRVVLVNLLGTVAVVRAALPDLKQRHGHVVTVGSTLGLKAVSDATAYCASKFGVTGFSRALAAETQGEVGVTMLVPGGMETSFFEGRDEQYKPPPDFRLNKPGNVAQAVVFALQQPEWCEVRELVVTPSVEGSWP